MKYSPNLYSFNATLRQVLLGFMFCAAYGMVQSAYAQDTTSDALTRLLAGNRRFAAGQALHPDQSPARIKELAAGQKPFAVILSCSDSRVSSEIIFDQGLGDLFIVRTAGQVSDYPSWGSLEFGAEVLDAKLILVLGHSSCGAVSAAVKQTPVPGHIANLVEAIRPAVKKAKNTPGNLLDNAIRQNVLLQVAQLKALEPVLAPRVRAGKLQIVGAVYHLDTGLVEIVSE